MCFLGEGDVQSKGMNYIYGRSIVFLANAFPTGKTTLGSLRYSSLIAMQFRYPLEQVDPKA